MTDPEQGWTLENVHEELFGHSARATREAEAWVSREIGASATRACDALTRPVRSPATSGTAPTLGDALIRRCAPDGRRRIALLLDQERMLAEVPGGQDDSNWLLAVFLAGTLFERELTRLLAEPARPLAAELAAAQKQHNRKHRTEGLEAWAEGRVPPTLGLVEQVMLGLRWGLEQGREAVLTLLRQRFAPPYCRLIADKGLVQTVSRVRTDYRNPACHGLRESFSTNEYRQLAQLLTGCETFAHWCQNPPESSRTPADRALLHHHLQHSLPAAAQMTAGGILQTTPAPPSSAPISLALRQRLFDLRAAAGDDWGFAVWVCPCHQTPTSGRAVRAVTRDLGDLPASTPRFPLGQGMCIGSRSERAGYLTVVDFGTSGRVWGLCPSNACCDSYAPAGRSFLPPTQGRWPAFSLTGDPGIERVLAIVTAEPLLLDWRPDDLTCPCRELHETDVAELLEQIARLPRTAWAADWCEFELYH